MAESSEVERWANPDSVVFLRRYGGSPGSSSDDDKSLDLGELDRKLLMIPARPDPIRSRTKARNSYEQFISLGGHPSRCFREYGPGDVDSQTVEDTGMDDALNHRYLDEWNFWENEMDLWEHFLRDRRRRFERSRRKGGSEAPPLPDYREMNQRELLRQYVRYLRRSVDILEKRKQREIPGSSKWNIERCKRQAEITEKQLKDLTLRRDGTPKAKTRDHAIPTPPSQESPKLVLQPEFETASATRKRSRGGDEREDNLPALKRRALDLQQTAIPAPTSHLVATQDACLRQEPEATSPTPRNTEGLGRRSGLKQQVAGKGASQHVASVSLGRTREPSRPVSRRRRPVVRTQDPPARRLRRSARIAARQALEYPLLMPGTGGEGLRVTR